MNCLCLKLPDRAPNRDTQGSYSAFHASVFIAYSMKNRGGKSGRICHDDACRNITEESHVAYLIFMNIIDRLHHECRRVHKQRAKDTSTEVLD